MRLKGFFIGILVLFLAGSGAPALWADENADAAQKAKLEDIRKLFAATGSADIAVQIMNQMVESFKTTMPNVPEKFWQDFMKEVKSDDLIEMIVPIYDKYLTHEEIKGLLGFYQSPVGKKFVSVLPQVTQESYLAGQKWGTELSEKVIKKLQDQGLDEKGAPPTPQKP